MRLEALLDRHERDEPIQEEATEMLGVSERIFRPHRTSPWAEGSRRDRLRDERPAANRRAVEPAVAEIVRMLGLYEERCSGFVAKHFHEQMTKRHDYKLGSTVTRLALQMLRAGTADGELLLAIEDTGPGIVPEMPTRIFEPLFGTKSVGTGLGPPTVKQIVNPHGRIIAVDSEAAWGTCVSVRLPLQAEAVQDMRTAA